MDIASKIYKIKYFQLIGSILGLVILIFSFFNIDNKFSSNEIVCIILYVLFFSANLYAYHLLERNKINLGLKLIQLTLLLQLFAFKFLGIFYTAINLLAIYFTIEWTQDIKFGFEVNFSHLIFSPNINSEIVEFKINILGFFLLFYVSNLID